MKKKIFILSLIVTLIIFLLIIFSSPGYKIEKQDCNLTLENPTCSEKIEIDSITFNGRDYRGKDLTKEILSENCIELKEDVFACGDYLISK